MTRMVTYHDDDIQRPTVGVVLAGDQVAALHTIADLASGLACLRGTVIRDIGCLLEQHPWPAVGEAITGALRDLPHGRLAGLTRPLKDLRVLAPVLRPTKVIGVGMNYQSFIAQIGEPPPAHPVLFHKTSSALTGHHQPIRIPPNTDQPVPEGELAIVIGRGGTFINEDQALTHIAGYTCANDISARNLEFRTGQWTSGKMLPTFCPLGPVLVTGDEIGNLQQLVIRTVLNGKVIQQGSPADMVFGVARLVAEISALVQLEAGDVILTGTPSDLGALEEPVYLTPGDTIRVEIDGIAALENPVRRLEPR